MIKEKRSPARLVVLRQRKLPDVTTPDALSVHSLSVKLKP